MPRINRVDVGGEVYHVLNRANARVQIFDNDKDYKQFDDILEEGVEKYDINLLAYCIMPNHWHLVLHPRADGELQAFMSWLTNTHTRRWHVSKETVGQGHLYQGRYKSFICEKDQYLLTLLRYVERNAKRAYLVKKAEDWRWSSVWRREKGTLKQKKMLSQWPIDLPKNYLFLLNEALTASEEESLDRSEEKSIPCGRAVWIDQIVKKYGIEQVLRGGWETEKWWLTPFPFEKWWLTPFLPISVEAIRTWYMHKESKVMVPNLQKDGKLMFK